jgi:hypothetical protein
MPKVFSLFGVDDSLIKAFWKCIFVKTGAD